MRIDQFISGEIADRLGDVLLLVGADGFILDANPAALDCYGYSRAEMLSLSTRDIRAPQDQGRIDRQMREAGEREVLFEAEDRRSDGTLFHVEVRSGPVSVDGETALLCLVRDITERKQAEQELRAASLYSRSLIEASLDPLVTIDPEGRISDVNRATEEVTGVMRDKLIGTDFSDYFTEPDKAREGYERVFSERRVVDYPLAIRHVSGKVTDVIYNATVYRNESGEVVGVFAAARDVTESRKAHEQAARLAAIVTSSQDAIFSKDFDETVTSWNAAAEALHGYSAEEMIGTDVEILTPAGREGEPRRLIERVRRGERISGFETQRSRKDGSVVEVSLTMSPILDDAGDIAAISVIGHDITERKQAEQELRESEERYRSILNASPDGITRTDLEGRMVGVSPSALTIFDCEREEELLGHLVTDFVVPEDRDRAASNIALMFQGIMSGPAEYRGLRADGSTFDIEANAVLIRDTEGQPTDMLFIVRDVTERKRSENALRESEQKLRTLFDLLPEGVAALDADGVVAFANPALARIMDTSQEGLRQGDHWSRTYLNSDGTPMPWEEFAGLVTQREGRAVYGVETGVVKKDGSVVWISVSSSPVALTDWRAIIVTTDITERKQAEEARRVSEAKLKKAQHYAHVGSWTWNIETDQLVWSDEMFHLFGIEQATFSGSLPEVIARAIHPDDRHKVEQSNLMVINDKKPIPLEYRVVWPDQSVHVVWAEAGELLLDEHGNPSLLSGIAQDITERKQAEDEILRLNAELEERVQERTEELESANSRLTEVNLKLEDATRAKSDFLASMSHELRTPLNSIIGFSSVMLQGLAGELNEEQNKQVGMINNSGQHLLELINEVLDLAKVESAQDRPTIRKVDVGAVARKMFDTVRPMAEAKGIEMQWTCPEDLRLIRTDKLRVGQILLNLMGNAVKFTEHGYVGVTVSQDDSGVTITVEDSGCGIAAGDLKRVFDDFYQVSPHISAKSEGTGLGLAVSRRLAESIEARIEVTSEPGRGSAFTLHIPERSRERDLPVGQSRIEL